MQLQKLLKSIAASMLLFVAGANALVHAQNTADAGTLAASGGSTPVGTIDLSGISASADANDASREFDVDLIVQSSSVAGAEFGWSGRMLYNKDELEIIEISNVQPAGLASPSTTVVSPIDKTPAVTVNGRSYDAHYVLSWGGTAKLSWLDNDGGWDTGLSLKIRYKKNGGDAFINWEQDSGSSAASWKADADTETRVAGPAVAQLATLSISTNRSDQVADGGGDTQTIVTCTLHDAGDPSTERNADAATTCTLTAATLTDLTTGSTVAAADIAKVGLTDTDSALTTTDISIASGEATGSQTFNFSVADPTSPDTGQATDAEDVKLSFDWRISAITGDSVTVAAGADSWGDALVNYKIVTAGVAVSAGGQTDCSSAIGAKAAIALSEGEQSNVCVGLLSDPGGNVSVTCDASTAGVQLSSSAGSLSGSATLDFTFTDVNRENGLIMSIALPDDDVAASSGAQTVTCYVTDGPSGSDYEVAADQTAASADIAETIALTLTDPDMVMGGSLAATATVSEKAGAAPITVTASITGSIVSATACTVAVTVGGAATGTPPAGTVQAMGGGATGDQTNDNTGYVGTLAIPSITIEANTRSGSSTPGTADATVTTSGDGVLVPTLDDDSDREYVRFSASGISCGNATGLDFGEAFTLIVDKTGGDSLKNLNYSVLPVATQFGLASAMNNIQTRATASRSGSDRQAVFSLSGDTTTESVLMTHMKGAAALDDANDYEYDWKKAFSNSSFSMPIFGAGGGTLWASGDYRTMNGDSGVVDWEGNSFLFNFGADARLNNDMLVGLMISMSDTDIDYTDTALDTTNKGEYTITNLALRPYFAWSVGRTDIWGSIGTGSGEVEVVQEGETMARVGDTSESSLSLGVKHALVEGLSVQADISTNSTTVDEKNGGSSADGGVDSQDIDSQRARVLLVGENSYNSANGTITPKVEIGFRFDSSETNNAFGKGESTAGSQEDNSTGTEAAMGVDVASGGRVMGLKARFYSGNDYDEWGISGIYEHHVGAGGLGLAMAMRPQYGNTASTTKSLFQQEFDNASNVKKTTVADAVNAPSMNSDISYGFAAPGDRGVITPYAKAVLGSNVATSSRLGMRWKPHSRFNVDVYGDNKAAADDYAMLLNWASKGPLDFALEGKRSEKAAGDISHSVVLKGTLDF